MDHDDEAQLIEDILDGEAEAYAVLVRRYQGPIYAGSSTFQMEFDPCPGWG